MLEKVLEGLKTVKTYRRVIITPAQAEKMLAENSENRPLTQTNIKKFADEMGEGGWEFNGDAVRVSTTGKLIDGQHRLLACIKSDVSIEAIIVDDLEQTTVRTIDHGKKRGGADAFHYAGYQNGSGLAAGFAVVAAYRFSRTFSVRNNQIDNHMKKGEDARDVLNRLGMQELVVSNNTICGMKSVNTEKIFPPARICALHFFLIDGGYLELDEATALCRKIVTGINCGPKDPIYRLNLYGRNAKNSNRKLTAPQLAQMLVQCWNSFATGSKKRHVKRPTEDYIRLLRRKSNVIFNIDEDGILQRTIL